MAAAIVMMPLPMRLRSLSSSFTCSSIKRKLEPRCYSSASRTQLVLYSKPGCCLCDGLKEKLHSAFSDPSYSLHNVDLQIRDITTNPEWERAYQYEIPVLARLRSDGTEEILPRFSPRAGVELIQKKLADALSRDV